LLQESVEPLVPDPVPSACRWVLSLPGSHSPQNVGVEEPCLHALLLQIQGGSGCWATWPICPSPPSGWMHNLVLTATTTLWTLWCLSISTAMAKPTCFLEQPHMCAMPRATTCPTPRCRARAAYPTALLPQSPPRAPR